MWKAEHICFRSNKYFFKYLKFITANTDMNLDWFSQKCTVKFNLSFSERLHIAVHATKSRASLFDELPLEFIK